LVLADAAAMLARTPAMLDVWLRPLPAAWATANEGNATWSTFDVVGHLIHGERTDWIPRARIIMSDGETRPFEPFDRFAQFEHSRGRTLPALLDEFTQLRTRSLQDLAALQISDADLQRTGHHPALGTVTLGQLLATWVAHDLDHIAQIARVLAAQYAGTVGPWRDYLRVISGKPG
jgi:uncharacterized damage-inducible protein DinB